jgi:hypothetical protein
MPRLLHPRAVALACAWLTTALVLAACGQQPGPSIANPSGPAASGGAACPTAPAVPDDLAGWTPPATAPALVPFLINSAGQVVCGQNRMLFTLLDTNGTPQGSPDRKMSIALYDLGRDPSKAIATVDGAFVWAIKDAVGIYVANTSFPEAGTYGAEVTTTSAGSTDTVRLTFEVQPSTTVIRVGDHAPASKTPTLADVGGDATKISTDANPAPAFYQTSVDQALSKHEPFVLIFATPKFCTSRQCGPTLDSIKPYVAKYPSVTFIHVEPYKLKLVDGVLQADLDAAGALQATAVTDEWHLVNEPTVYVVNRDGVVTANFDLIFSDAELTAALKAVE